MPGSGPLRVVLAGLALSGCAATPKLCEKPDNTTVAYGNVTMSAPEGCWFTGDADSPVRTISCDDGRQGLTIADVSEIPVGANE